MIISQDLCFSARGFNIRFCDVHRLGNDNVGIWGR